MGYMKASVKASLVIIGLALLACIVGLIWLGTRSNETDEPIAESLSDATAGPSFEVRIVVPRMARAFGGILPDALVKKLDGTPSELRFDHTSPGARIVSVGPDRLELSADGWEVFIETDGHGTITPATHLVFPITLGGRQVRLNCRPADPATGYLSTTPRAGSTELAGRFLVELAICKNADSGRLIEWPPRPLTVRGRFAAPAK